MNIGLIQIDGKMPNIALMKISQYHKSIGNSIEWIKYFNKYDIVYTSQIFNFSTPDTTYINSGEIIKGGTGISLKKELPKDIESCDPDYSIYNCNYSIQMFSRGCVRKCPFCVVNEKEGRIRPVKHMKLNPKGKHIEIFDNNFFANPEWKSAINLLLKWKQKVNFHGIDIRIMNEEQAFYLNKLRHKKQIHIAWDNPKDNLLPKIKEVIKYIKPYKIMCYVLIGYWSNQDQDEYRVTELDKLGITPFVMPFNKKDKYQADYATFVNKRWIYKACNGNFKLYNRKNFKTINESQYKLEI